VTQTAHQAIRDAIVTLLQASPALAGGRVVANRRRPMAAQDASQVYVYLETSDATQNLVNKIDWRTRIRIECVARSVTGTSAEDAADALASAAYARIAADPTLGGKAVEIEVQALGWFEDEADTALAACQQVLSVWHQTETTSL
jgi:hypothetical protein